MYWTEEIWGKSKTSVGDLGQKEKLRNLSDKRCVGCEYRRRTPEERQQQIAGASNSGSESESESGWVCCDALSSQVEWQAKGTDCRLYDSSLDSEM